MLPSECEAHTYLSNKPTGSGILVLERHSRRIGWLGKATLRRCVIMGSWVSLSYSPGIPFENFSETFFVKRLTRVLFLLIFI